MVVSNEKIFGIIRKFDKPSESYDHENDKSQYTELSEFVIDFV